MDTDIDNYSHKDILQVLKIRDDSTLDIDYLHKKVKSALAVVEKNAADLETPQALRDFFKQCFIRVSVVKGFEITEPIRQSLDLAPLPVIIDEPTVTRPQDSQQIETQVTFPGALPPSLPSYVTNSTAPLAYTRGLVNPVERETITTQLILNSRFRPEYDRNQFTAQGDRIQAIALCADPGQTAADRKRIQALAKLRSGGCEEPEVPEDDPSYNQVYYGSGSVLCPGTTPDLRVNNHFVGSVADYSVELEDPYSDVVSIKLASLQMLNSYRACSQHLGTNEFTVTIFVYDSAPGANLGLIGQAIPTTIRIAEGNYTVFTLRDALNTVFTSQPQLYPIECVYHALTGRLRFKLRATDATLGHSNPPTSGATHRWGFDLNFTIREDRKRRIDLNLGWMMGFRKMVYNFHEDYNPSANTVNPSGIVAEAIANLMGTPYFLLEVDDFNNNNSAVINYNNPGKAFNVNSRNLLAQIPNAAAPYEMLFEDSSDRIYKSREYFGPVRIRKLRIRLLDEYGRIINLYGGELSITLEVTTLNKPYKKMTV